MSELISREAAIAEITSWIFTDEDLEGEGDEYRYFNRGLKRAIKALAEVPAVDAVEVVRCKDCKQRGLPSCPMWHEEYFYDEDDGGDYYTFDNTTDDGYCHCGAKMDLEVDG
jgi:hypothetical protein